MNIQTETLGYRRPETLIDAMIEAVGGEAARNSRLEAIASQWGVHPEHVEELYIERGIKTYATIRGISMEKARECWERVDEGLASWEISRMWRMDLMLDIAPRQAKGEL
jgi:hypothetical protein